MAPQTEQRFDGALKRASWSWLSWSWLCVLLCGCAIQGRAVRPFESAAQLHAEIGGYRDQQAQDYLTGVFDLSQALGWSCAVPGAATPSQIEQVFERVVASSPTTDPADPAAARAAQAFAVRWSCRTTAQWGAVDRQFSCPGALTSEAARAREALAGAVRHLAPSAGPVAIELYWQELLREHHCAAALLRLQQRQAQVRRGDISQVRWLSLGEVAVHDRVELAANALAPAVDPRYPRERPLVGDIRVRFAHPRQMLVPRLQYDLVISRNVFYCGLQRYAVVRNDFYWAGRLVHRGIRQPIPIGTARVYEPVPAAGDPYRAAAMGVICPAGDLVAAARGLRQAQVSPAGLSALLQRQPERARRYLMGVWDAVRAGSDVCPARSTPTPERLEQLFSADAVAFPAQAAAAPSAAALALRAFAARWPEIRAPRMTLGTTRMLGQRTHRPRTKYQRGPRCTQCAGCQCQPRRARIQRPATQ